MRRCEFGCTCRKHDSCQPNCTCGKHTRAGKRCEVGCTCRRHLRTETQTMGDRRLRQRPQVRRDMKCIVVEENGEKCQNYVRNLKRQMCSLHYNRLQRNGHTSKSKFYRWNPNPNQSRRLTIDKQTGVDIKRCMCIHNKNSHRQTQKKNAKECMIDGCLCDNYSSVNERLFETIAIKLLALGFTSILNDTAWCENCNKYIIIGHWSNEVCLRRASIHSYKTCQNKPKNYAIESRPNRVKGL